MTSSRMRRGMVDVAAATVFGVFLAAATVRAQPADVGRERIRPDRDPARLIAVSGSHALWVTSEVVPGTEQDVAQTYTIRFYRQAIKEFEAVLIDTWTSTSRGVVAAVADDGTVASYQFTILQWYRPDGQRLRMDLGQIPVLAIYPDGLLLQDGTSTPQAGNGADAVEFIPFEFIEQGGVAVGSRTQIVPAGVKRFRFAEPVRHRNRFAWIQGGRLHVLDLTDGASTTPLKFGLPRDARLTAYDGETAVVGLFAFDAKTGALLGETDPNKRPRQLTKVFAVRHRIGYFHEKGSLMAVDLTSHKGEPVAIAQAKADVPSADTDAGLVVWDGSRWKTAPWIKEWKPVANKE